MKPEAPQAGDDFAFFLSIAAKLLVRSSEPKPFLDWAAEYGPKLLPAMAARAHPPVAEMFRALGRQIYDAIPLPDAGFRPRQLPKPGRNDPCSCGSGRKYKHCCLRLEGAPLPLHEFNLLRYVLDSLPAKRFGELPASHVDPDAVWDTARQWLEEHETRRAIALLEPWFAEGRGLTGRLEPMFDLLMDCYLDAGNEGKRRRLIEKALARGDRELRSGAMQRRAAVLADQGRRDEAWASFHDAQREDPTNPSLAHLELTLLASEGDFDRAGERARFWIATLERRRDPRLADLIGLLRAVAADPRGAMAGISRRMVPGAERLKALFDRAPAPAPRYRFEPSSGSAGPMSADASLEREEARWRAAFPQRKPGLVATQHGDPSAWETSERWLAVLESSSDLWQSLDVLDDLAMAVDALPGLGSGHDLLEPMLERGTQLLRMNLEHCGLSDARFEWGWMQNRPALRMAAHLAFRRHEAHDWGPFVALAEWILRLNPDDNHGLRDYLSRAYLESGATERVLEIFARYPGGGTALTMNAILAAHRCGRAGEALTMLGNAADRCSEAVSMLIAANPGPPRMKDGWIAVGGKDEAWLYRGECRHLWERDGALEWFKAAWKTVPRRRPPARS